MQKIVTEQRGTLAGGGFFDFGQAAYGTLEVELKGVFQEHIELVVGEVASDGKIVHEPGWRAFLTDRIKLKMGFTVTASGNRGWLHMLAQGSTITMESWGENEKPFQGWTHAWGAAPANLIPRWVAGLRPTRPGFAEYTLDPHPGPLSWFRYRQPTPAGPIDVIFENGRCRAERHYC